NLQDNQLQALSDDVFNPLAELKTLGLNGNALTTLPPGVLDGLNHINLQENQLQTLPADVFNLLTELKTLGLNRNAHFMSHCECYGWIRENSAKVKNGAGNDLYEDPDGAT
uniref:Variable lymphocyte receptor B cassette n=2 Tax=Petromyzon marinus TaxID=7757 RepID=S4RD65_PETMA